MTTQQIDDLHAALDEAVRHNVTLAAKIIDLRGALRPADRSPAAPAAAHTEGQPAFGWAPGERERLALRPIRHEDIWSFRKKIESLHWTAQEVDLTKDKKDWDTRMTDDERAFVKYQLAFFARIDVDVLENLAENFGKEVDCLEAEMAYAAQADQECAHTESYSLQIEAVMSGEERETVLNAVRTMPIIARMRAWVMRWFDRGLPVGDRLAAFAAVEGVLFQASFASLQWLRERNLLPGITEANSFIARDEGVHTLLSCTLVRRYLLERPTQDRVEAIFGGVIELLDEFVQESLPVRLIGMNADLMRRYVRFQADCVIIDMGYVPFYRVENPFRFMDKLTLNEVSKTNFFEARPTQYQNVVRAGAARLAIDTTPVDDV